MICHCLYSFLYCSYVLLYCQDMFVSARDIKFNVCVRHVFLMCSNCPSLCMCLTFKPYLWYAWTPCLIDVSIVAAFSFFVSSVVPECMPCDIVIRIMIEVICIMSVSKVTFPCFSSFSVGRSAASVTTWLLFLHVVLPCSHPMLVPKMSSARTMSACVTGQLGNMFPSMYCLKSFVWGWPIISCREHTCKTSEYSLRGFLDLFLFTVLIKTYAMSFETSENKSPFWMA